MDLFEENNIALETPINQFVSRETPFDKYTFLVAPHIPHILANRKDMATGLPVI